MKTGIANASDLLASTRLDSKFFLDAVQASYARLQGGKWPLVSVGDSFGRDNIRMPNRFTRIPARSPEHGKPLLVPYDCFRYLPKSDYFLSKSQVAIYPKIEVRRGWLLIVCSGRNLGPVTLVDGWLERFVISHDMIRIAVPLSDELFYLAAMLHTRLGRAMIRLDRNRSVIDHLDNHPVAALRYPVVRPDLMAACVKAFRRGFELREKARLDLDSTQRAYPKCVGLDEAGLKLSDADRRRRFSINRSDITGRIDSEAFSPLYGAYCKQIALSPGAATIETLAAVFEPGGRPKSLYVNDEKHGVKAMSGRQIAQYVPIGLKIMSRKAWDRPAAFILKKDIVLLASDGRAEENLADCVLIREDREGWAASEHVHRLEPRKGTHPGLLWLGCSCKPVQEIFKSLATGSVVDALSVPDVAGVMIPHPETVEGRELGDVAVSAWDFFAEATRIEANAVVSLESELSLAIA